MSSVNRSLRAIFPKLRRSKPKNRPITGADDSNLERAVKRFKKSCEDPRFRHNQATYRLTVARLAAAKKFSAIESILDQQKSYDDIRCEGFAARLIALYGRSGMFGHARKLFDELPALRCERGIVSFNALLKAALDAKEFGSVAEVFNELPEKVSVEPDLISYNIVIHAHCAAGDLDGAVAMFHELEKNGKEPDLFTFNTLLNALYKSGRFSEGESLFAAMESKKIAPNVRTYNAKLRGVFHENAAVKADEVVNEMESKGIRPDKFSYNALISGYCENGELEEALKWYRELQRNECAPDCLTYMKLIPACCEEGDLDSAVELCSEAISRRLLLKVEIFNQVVSGLVVEDKTEEASELVELVNSANFLNYKLKSPVA